MKFMANNTIGYGTTYSSDNGITISLTPQRIVDLEPKTYRLLKKPSGELVLQGAYRWYEGVEGGFVWKDIPTVIE